MAINKDIRTNIKTNYIAQSKHSTVSGYVRLIVRSLEADGLDAQKLCAQSGINYNELKDSDARIAQSKVTALWHHAVHASGNEALALNLAANVTTDALHLLGYSLMSSMTLLEGCQRFIRYQRVVGELFDISMNECDAHFELDFGYRETDESFVPQSIDAAMAVMAAYTRWLTQSKTVSPSAIYLMRTEPIQAKAYTDLFQCPVYFSHNRNQMHYHEETMALMIPTAHKELATLHDQLLGGYLDKLDKLSITDMVEEKLMRMLPSGLPKAEALAKALNISSRTLHRRLSEEGLNFQTCLEQVRKKLARVYLESSLDQAELSLKEVAYLLGFSEPSSFYRAFKRWYSKTPGQFLEELSG